jgi:hypothetical protein
VAGKTGYKWKHTDTWIPWLAKGLCILDIYVLCNIKYEINNGFMLCKQSSALKFASRPPDTAKTLASLAILHVPIRRSTTKLKSNIYVHQL